MSKLKEEIKRKILFEDKNSIEKISELNGKTIDNIITRTTWDEKEIAYIHILFTDGTSIEIVSGTTAGCPECDPDGRAINYLQIN